MEHQQKRIIVGPGADRLVISMVCVVLSLALCSSVMAQEKPMTDKRYWDNVIVGQIVLELRAVDTKGNPILGLTPTDLRLKVDDKEVPLVDLEWVGGTDPVIADLTPEDKVALEKLQATPTPTGRLLVFLFQTDFTHERLTGLMQMKTKAIKMLEDLKPEDKVAVLSFDYRLKLRQDFTNDRAKITEAIQSSISFSNPPSIEPGAAPSLAKYIDSKDAKDAASIEKGLLVLAKALRQLPGAKSVAFFGWGVGTLSGGVVRLGSAYAEARRELIRGRVTVFAIDVTDADYHTLEIGLMQVAEDTGGFYAKTNLFPGQAMHRLEGAISGFYQLVFERPPGPRGMHSVAVELVKEKGRILMKENYID